MAITFFKIPRHKQFNYRPLYYDPRKEEREKRLKTAIESDEEDYEQALRDRIQMRWKRTTGSLDRRASNRRLLIIVAIIILIFYFIFLR